MAIGLGLRTFQKKSKRVFVTAVDALYPPLCMSCGSEVASPGFCAACFAQFEAIAGTICETCAVPLMGDAGEAVQCDRCMNDNPPWLACRAVALYGGASRKVVLSLKHGDRLDLGGTMAQWMLDAGFDLTRPDIVLPIPLHWRRLMKRKYNQAAELARPIAKRLDSAYQPHLLTRKSHTPMQKDLSKSERIAQQAGTIIVAERFKNELKNKNILLVDDVMTTGATLRAASQACLGAGAKTVNILVFARVVAPWEMPI